MSGTDPFDEMERLFDHLTQFGGTVGGDLAVDVVDEGESFLVVADLPGYDTDDIDVQLQDERRLHISATRTEDSEVAEGDYVRRERRQQSASRTVSLPEPVDESETGASYDDGVLRVRLGKQATAGEGTDIPVN